MTSWPGHSRWSVFGNSALSWTVPVVWTIWSVDEQDLAFAQLDLVVLAVGRDRQRPLGHLLLNLRQLGLREREDQRDRLDLRDDHETVRIGRVNDVADVDLPDAGDARDRRCQPCITELDVGLIDERAVGLDRALQLRDLRRLRFHQLRRGIALVAELVIAGEIGLCIGELCAVALEIGGQLVDLGLVRARIDLREEVSRLDGLSLDKRDLGELALNLASNDVGVVGDDGTDAAQVDRHVLAGDGRGNHGYLR